MVKTLSAKQARSSFETLFKLVSGGKNTVLVEEQGKPMVAVIDFDRYQTLVRKRFSVLAFGPKTVTCLRGRPFVTPPKL